MNRIEAHPDAAIFPMMSADELADLAADIKENGQRFPIVVGPYEGREVIVDGRNRYEACEIAGVEPKFEKLNGHDPKAFILSMNINRRHLSTGQRAMAAAMIYPVGRHGKVVPDQDGIRRQKLYDARVVLRHSRSLADQVISGAVALDAAFKEAKAALDTAKSGDAMLASLHTEAPDLADLVTEERMTLMEATAAARERVDSLNRQRRLTAEELSRSINFFVQANVDAATRAAQMIELVNPTNAAPKLIQMAETLELLIAEAKKGQTDVGQQQA